MDKAGIYLVATPIGNRQDITFRAVHVLTHCDAIFCEDTRISRKLLSSFSISTKIYSYHEHNGEKMRPKIYSAVQEGKRIALICDAGTPLISDPGFKLVQGAIKRGMAVVPIPGVCAPVTALMAAGLCSDRFIFLGFLPRKILARETLFQGLTTAMGTVIFFERPNRLEDTLRCLVKAHPTADVVVARELTKKFEHFIRGTARDVLQNIGAIPKKGEMVLLVCVKGDDHNMPDVDTLLLRALKVMRIRDAVAVVAPSTAMSKSDIYKRALRLVQENAIGEIVSQTKIKTKGAHDKNNPV